MGVGGRLQRVGKRCLGAFLIAGSLLAGCSGSSGKGSDPDYSETCELVEQIGQEHVGDAVNEPIERLAAAAPAGTAIERISLKMAGLDPDVRDDAVAFAELSAELDRELAKVCPGSTG